jgi:D-alanyl-D-alanine carboxypeptidase
MAGRSAPAAVAVAAAPVAATASPAAIALGASDRPLPRANEDGSIARNSESIAAAIAEVNAELAASQVARNAPGGLDPERPMPRPGTTPASAVAKATVGSASTFAVATATAATRPRQTETVEPISVANSGTATTGGNDWGVQLGAFRAKGDAERQLLTTALMDVPELNGGLRRVEAAKVQGVTVFRAQFVGLSQASALGACETLARLQADCLPLAPGI